MRDGKSSLVSLDVPWKRNGKGNCTAAYLSPRGSLAWTDVTRRAGLDTDAIGSWLREHASPAATVLIDIPIAGCEGLRSGEYRRLEIRLKRLQMGVLPAGNAGDLGRILERLTIEALPRARVLESHPYSVLKVLWALAVEGVTGCDLAGELRPVLGAGFAHTWPPKYKRERKSLNRRAAVRAVRDLLLDRILTVPVAGDPEDLLEEKAGRIAADRIDAILGLVPGILLERESPWFYEASDPVGGSIAMVADEWWRGRFEALEPQAETGS